jgi:hypothetical protein
MSHNGTNGAPANDVCLQHFGPLPEALLQGFMATASMQRRARAGKGSTEARAQYAHIEDLKPAQTILSHPKSPTS